MGPLIAAQCGLARAQPGCPPAFVPVNVRLDPRIYRGQAGPGTGARHNAYQVAWGRYAVHLLREARQVLHVVPNPTWILQETDWCELGCGHTASALSLLLSEAQGGRHF